MYKELEDFLNKMNTTISIRYSHHEYGTPHTNVFKVVVYRKGISRYIYKYNIFTWDGDISNRMRSPTVFEVLSSLNMLPVLDVNDFVDVKERKALAIFTIEYNGMYRIFGEDLDELRKIIEQEEEL